MNVATRAAIVTALSFTVSSILNALVMTGAVHLDSQAQLAVVNALTAPIDLVLIVWLIAHGKSLDAAPPVASEVPSTTSPEATPQH